MDERRRQSVTVSAKTVDEAIAEAERELGEAQSPRRRLLEAERQLELGLLSVEEYEAIENEALERLELEEESRRWPS